MRQDTITTSTVITPTCSQPTHFLFVPDLMGEILKWIAPEDHPNHDFFSFIYAIKSLSKLGREIFDHHTNIPFLETKETSKLLLRTWYLHFIRNEESPCYYTLLPFASRLAVRLSQCRFILNEDKFATEKILASSHFNTVGKKKQHDSALLLVPRHFQDFCADREARARAIATQIVLNTLAMGVRHYYWIALLGLLYAAFIAACILLSMEASKRGCFVFVKWHSSSDVGSCDAPMYHGGKVYSCLDENIGRYFNFTNNPDLLKGIQHACDCLYVCDCEKDWRTRMSDGQILVKICDTAFKAGAFWTIGITCFLHAVGHLVCGVYEIGKHADKRKKTAPGHMREKLDDQLAWFVYFFVCSLLFAPFVYLPVVPIVILHLLANVTFLMLSFVITAAETGINKLFPQKIPNGINLSSFFSEKNKQQQDLLFTRREPLDFSHI